MRKILLTLVAAMCCIALQAETIYFDCGENGDNMWAEFNTGSGALFLVGTGAMADYEKVEDVPWYKYKDQITSIQKDDRSQYTRIGDYAFWGYTKLTSIDLPNTVDTIGRNAFRSCRKLQEINFPTSLKCISYFAFAYCDALTSLILPNGLEEVGTMAFSQSETLASVTIPASVKKVGWSAFGGCSSLTAINVDSNNATYCSLNGVLFSKDQKTLCAFPAGIEGSYTVPSSVETIDHYAFFSCDKLAEVIIPQGVTRINNYVFAHCKFEHIELPEGLTYLGESVFWYSKLTSVILPSTLKQIGYGCFDSCKSLTSITCKAPTPPTCKEKVFENVDLTACKLYVPAASLTAYKAADTWKDFGNNILPLGEGIEDIVAPTDKARKVMMEGQLFIATPDGKIYNATGAEVK